MSSDKPYIVILTGGMEIVSVSIAEELEGNSLIYAVISLLPKTLLDKAKGCHKIFYIHKEKESIDKLRTKLLNILFELHKQAGRKLILLATEDGGLRYLHELSEDILRYAEFPRARALGYGGLDKAELFEYLKKTPASKWLPETLILNDFEEAEGALLKLGQNAIFKPALKPMDMHLSSMGSAKVVSISNSESVSELLVRLKKAWPLSTRWVAQERLITGAGGESGAWVVRGDNESNTVQFSERWKYPKIGGTGCWVETQSGDQFTNAAAEILSAIDYIGLAELPFLQAEDGSYRLIEINTRAWLQVGLAEKSGLQPILRTINACSDELKISETNKKTNYREWINFERAALAAISGEVGSRLNALGTLLKITLRKPVIAIYGTSVKGVKARWISRVFKKILGLRS